MTCLIVVPSVAKINTIRKPTERSIICQRVQLYVNSGSAVYVKLTGAWTKAAFFYSEHFTAQSFIEPAIPGFFALRRLKADAVPTVYDVSEQQSYQSY